MEQTLQEQALQTVLHQTIIDKTNLQIALEMANAEIKRLNELLKEKEGDK